MPKCCFQKTGTIFLLSLNLDNLSSLNISENVCIVVNELASIGRFYANCSSHFGNSTNFVTKIVNTPTAARSPLKQGAVFFAGLGVWFLLSLRAFLCNSRADGNPSL